MTAVQPVARPNENCFSGSAGARPNPRSIEVDGPLDRIARRRAASQGTSQESAAALARDSNGDDERCQPFPSKKSNRKTAVTRPHSHTPRSIPAQPNTNTHTHEHKYRPPTMLRKLAIAVVGFLSLSAAAIKAGEGQVGWLLVVSSYESMGKGSHLLMTTKTTRPGPGCRRAPPRGCEAPPRRLRAQVPEGGSGVTMVDVGGGWG